MQKKRPKLRKTDRFAAMSKIWELFRSNLNNHETSSEYLWISEILYLMRQQIAFGRYNLNKLHCYGLLWKSLSDARFPYTYRSVSHAVKALAGDWPNHIKITINYMKHLVQNWESNSWSKAEQFLQTIYTQV